MIAVAGGGTMPWASPRTFGPGDVYGVLRDFKFAALAEGAFFSSRGLRQNSQVTAAAFCLRLSPGYDGAHMVHPLAWPTQLPGSEQGHAKFSSVYSERGVPLPVSTSGGE